MKFPVLNKNVIFLILVLNYQDSISADILPDCTKDIISSPSVGTIGIIGETPEILTDTLGNVLDIDDLPEIPRVPVPDLIKKEGYPVETHYVTTEDGYILTVHRIPYGKKGLHKGDVIYLQHGLLLASSDWVLFGPENGLAYILADAGYDVWMGNSRGNLYSRNHTTLSPEEKEFWLFSWHEMGIYDVPNTIDYILANTGVKSIFHIGHSQGTTSFYVMTSEKPAYNKKIKAHISLSPVVFMNHLYSPLLRILAPGILPIEVVTSLVGQYEFLPRESFLSLLVDPACSASVGKVLCKNVAFAITGFSPKERDVSSIPLIKAHYPAGAATKQLIHYGQEINSGQFRKFDYGLKNSQIYGSPTPPNYKLAHISAPIHLIYSSNDWLAAVVDVERLYKLLPNVKELYKVSIKTWNHMDFQFAINVVPVVYKKVIQILSLY